MIICAVIKEYRVTQSALFLVTARAELNYPANTMATLHQNVRIVI